MWKRSGKLGGIRRWLQPAALVTMIAGLALLAGCGDDDSPSATNAASNAGAEATTGDSNGNAQPEKSSGKANGSQAGFVAEANAACQKRRVEFQKKGKKIFQDYYSKPPEQGARAMAQMAIIPTFEKELADLSELNPPEDEAAQVAELEAAIRKMLAQLRENPTADDFYPYNEAEAAADEAGLTSCGRP